MTVNAGKIPANHWVQNPEVGGGRFVGESCHFIDLLRFLVGKPIKRFYSSVMVNNAENHPSDQVTINPEFEDGSIGIIHYLANGHRSFPKERLEIFCGGGILQLDNFKVLKGYGWPGFRKMKLEQQDKGQNNCVAAFVESIRRGAPSPIPVDQILEVSRISIKVVAQH